MCYPGFDWHGVVCPFVCFFSTYRIFDYICLDEAVFQLHFDFRVDSSLYRLCSLEVSAHKGMITPSSVEEWKNNLRSITSSSYDAPSTEDLRLAKQPSCHMHGETQRPLQFGMDGNSYHTTHDSQFVAPTSTSAPCKVSNSLFLSPSLFFIYLFILLYVEAFLFSPPFFQDYESQVLLNFCSSIPSGSTPPSKKVLVFCRQGGLFFFLDGFVLMSYSCIDYFAFQR